MIDWHSHFLPGMDDGSRDVTESLQLIAMLAEQGVETAIATPHYYADNESVNAFLSRRAEAYAQLKAVLPKDAPDILLGAEVRYYPGISRLESLEALRIERSKVLLLEMPITTWPKFMVGELFALAGKNDFCILLAHIERYMRLQTADLWERLSENGILMQVNTSLFLSPLSVHKAVSLLKRGNVLLVGSDCHNIKNRPPQFKKAFQVIREKLGGAYIEQMDSYGYTLLEKTL